MDSLPKKRYDYEDKYDRYDKYDKYSSNHQCKYHIIKDFSQNYNQHNSSSNKTYRSRDGWHLNNNKYHGNYQSKSPRRDYKKPMQKYSTETEGVRNLSHCEMPAAQKKQEDQSDKSLIQGINTFVSNIVSSQFPPQQGAYQHINQNQQHINIKINLRSGTQLNLNGSNNRKKNSNYVEGKDKDKNKEDKDEMSRRPCPVPRPSPKTDIVLFKRDSVKIEDNPLDTFSHDASVDVPLEQNANDVDVKCQGQVLKPSFVAFEPNYLLAKIPNWRLVTNFVSGAQLSEEKYENVPIDPQIKEKFYIVYDEKYNTTVEKSTEENKSLLTKTKNDISLSKQVIEHLSKDIKKIQSNIYKKDWRNTHYKIKQEEIDNAIKENTKES